MHYVQLGLLFSTLLSVLKFST